MTRPSLSSDTNNKKVLSLTSIGEFHFVTPIGPGLEAKGKGSPNVIKAMSGALQKRGVASEILTSEELIQRGLPTHSRAHAVLHFNELNYLQAGEPQALTEIETQLQELGYSLHHTASAARIIGDKRRQNETLTSAGVPMPELIKEASQTETVFSNEL